MKCKSCKVAFKPIRPMQSVCSLDCAQYIARHKREQAETKRRQAERRADRAKREDLKSVSDLEKDAEREVNRYVRLRDAGNGCISCTKPATWDGQWHASHFRSVGAASAVRFNLWNIHKSCSQCNHNKSGNIIDYWPRLIALIGTDKVQWIMNQNKVTRYSRDYLKRLRLVFKRKADRQKLNNDNQ